jgi:hypothetical protein
MQHTRAAVCLPKPDKLVKLCSVCVWSMSCNIIHTVSCSIIHTHTHTLRVCMCVINITPKHTHTSTRQHSQAGRSVLQHHNLRCPENTRYRLSRHRPSRNGAAGIPSTLPPQPSSSPTHRGPPLPLSMRACAGGRTRQVHEASDGISGGGGGDAQDRRHPRNLQQPF